LGTCTRRPFAMDNTVHGIAVDGRKQSPPRSKRPRVSFATESVVTFARGCEDPKKLSSPQERALSPLTDLSVSFENKPGLANGAFGADDDSTLEVFPSISELCKTPPDQILPLRESTSGGLGPTQHNVSRALGPSLDSAASNSNHSSLASRADTAIRSDANMEPESNMKGRHSSEEAAEGVGARPLLDVTPGFLIETTDEQATKPTDVLCSTPVQDREKGFAFRNSGALSEASGDVTAQITRLSHLVRQDEYDELCLAGKKADIIDPSDERGSSKKLSMASEAATPARLPEHFDLYKQFKQQANGRASLGSDAEYTSFSDQLDPYHINCAIEGQGTSLPMPASFADRRQGSDSCGKQDEIQQNPACGLFGRDPLQDAGQFAFESKPSSADHSPDLKALNSSWSGPLEGHREGSHIKRSHKGHEHSQFSPTVDMGGLVDGIDDNDSLEGGIIPEGRKSFGMDMRNKPVKLDPQQAICRNCNNTGMDMLRQPCSCQAGVRARCKSCNNTGIDLLGQPCSCKAGVKALCKSCSNTGVDILGKPCTCKAGLKAKCKNCNNTGMDLLGQPCSCEAGAKARCKSCNNTGVDMLGQPCSCKAGIKEVCKSCNGTGVDMLGEPCSCKAGVKAQCKSCNNTGMDLLGHPCSCKAGVKVANQQGALNDYLCSELSLHTPHNSSGISDDASQQEGSGRLSHVSTASTPLPGESSLHPILGAGGSVRTDENIRLSWEEFLNSSGIFFNDLPAISSPELIPEAAQDPNSTNFGRCERAQTMMNAVSHLRKENLKRTLEELHFKFERTLKEYNDAVERWDRSPPTLAQIKKAAGASDLQTFKARLETFRACCKAKARLQWYSAKKKWLASDCQILRHSMENVHHEKEELMDLTRKIEALVVTAPNAAAARLEQSDFQFHAQRLREGARQELQQVVEADCA